MVHLKSLSEETGCIFLMAVKAFPEPRVLAMARRYLQGFDVSNPAELRLVASVRGMIWWTNPAGTAKDRLRRRNVVRVCESPEQIPRRGTYAIRLNTDSVLGSEVRSRFGVRIGDLNIFRSMIALNPRGFSGFHMHHGWQKNRVVDYVRLAHAAVRLSKKLDIPLPFLNLGGGFGEFSPRELASMVRRVRKIVPESTKLVFEAGRFLSTGSGFAVGRVMNIRTQGRTTTCALDLSASIHLQWSKPSLVWMAPVGSRKTREIEFVGPTCFEGDRIGKFWVSGGELSVGARVLFSGVVGYSVARNQAFNGRDKAKVRFIR